MKRVDLIKNVARKGQVTQKVASRVVKDVFLLMRKELINGNKIEVRGFGRFKANRYRERLGRNPKTSKPILIKSKSIPRFSMGEDLKRRVNRKRMA